MLRRILACFALLTGLVAAGAPAQAEVVALTSRIEVSASGATAAHRQAKPVIAYRMLSREFAAAEPAAPAGEPACVMPAVRLRSDRARE